MKHCKSLGGWLLCWLEIFNSKLATLDIDQQTTTKITRICDKLKFFHDQHKIHADKHTKSLGISCGIHIVLKLLLWKEVGHFGKRGKLSPCYVGPLNITERIGLVSYKLKIPEDLSPIHDTFHVSNLKKYLEEVSLHVPFEDLQSDDRLKFMEEPI